MIDDELFNKPFLSLGLYNYRCVFVTIKGITMFFLQQSCMRYLCTVSVLRATTECSGQGQQKDVIYPHKKSSMYEYVNSCGLILCG